MSDRLADLEQLNAALNAEVVRLRAQRDEPRRRLPTERPGITLKWNVGNIKGYATVSTFPDGRPGELFIICQHGSTVAGLLDAWAIAVSLALQYGCPPDTLAAKFDQLRFEPMGFTGNPDVPFVGSIVALISRWMVLRFSPGVAPVGAEAPTPDPSELPTMASVRAPEAMRGGMGPPCSLCNSITRPSGHCFVCENCGETTGCS